MCNFIDWKEYTVVYKRCAQDVSGGRFGGGAAARRAGRG